MQRHLAHGCPAIAGPTGPAMTTTTPASPSSTPAHPSIGGKAPQTTAGQLQVVMATSGSACSAPQASSTSCTDKKKKRKRKGASVSTMGNDSDTKPSKRKKKKNTAKDQTSAEDLTVAFESSSSSLDGPYTN